jgi:hypothetical protein
MKLIVEIEMREGEHPADALRRELHSIVVRDYPLVIPLPGDGDFEVVIPQQAYMEDPPRLRTNTMGLADGMTTFEIRRVK